MPRIDRRQMLLGSAAMAAGVYAFPSSKLHAANASEKLNIACVGVGGKGWSDMHETSVGQNVVAICDVDEGTLAKAAEAFPNAKRYTDWRKLLEQKDIDAVTVSTPDHMHAPVAMSAISLGKHIYCQKPLCHSVFEARRLTEAAAAQRVVTQMGIQHHSTPRFKTAAKLIREGVIGKVREAHVWTDRPGTYWTQGFERPAGSDPVPSGVHWDLWLGVAPERPFVSNSYHPFRWRAFWDFGTGAMGDMGCHGMDPVVHAVELSAPRKVTAETSGTNGETGPLWTILHYEFPGTKHTTDNFKMVWYDGGKRPSADLFGGGKYHEWLNGVLYIGDKGSLVVDYENLPVLLPTEKFADFKIEAEPADNHYLQWTEACKGNGQTSTPFSYSGPLTETVLLGNVALRTGKAIEWDAKNLKAIGCPEADQFLRREYRNGWSVKGLS